MSHQANALGIVQGAVPSTALIDNSELELPSLNTLANLIPDNKTSNYLRQAGSISSLVQAASNGNYLGSGMALAGLDPSSGFADVMNKVGSVNNLAQAASSGNYLGAGMALAGFDPNSEFSQTMGKIGSASQVLSAIQQGSIYTAGMSLAGIAPGSDFSKALAQVAQAKSVYNSVKQFFTPEIPVSNFLSHLKQAPSVASVEELQSTSGNVTAAGSASANIVGGAMALKTSNCNGAKSPDEKSNTQHGSPVNAVYGSKVLTGEDDIDHIGRGYLSFSLVRMYNSQNPDVGWFGQGWASTGYEQRLEIDEAADRIYLIDNTGREIPFYYINEGEYTYQPFENLTLYRPTTRTSDSNDEQTATEPKLEFIIYTDEINPRVSSNFNGVAQHFGYVLKSRKKGRNLIATLLPSKQTDQYGHQLQFYRTYSHSKFNHLPSYIVDDMGDCYQLDFTAVSTQPNSNDENINDNDSKKTDIQPRLSKVSIIIDEKTTDTIVEYNYNDTGDLIQVKSGDKVVREFAYINHLMTWHKMPNGREAHYRYQQADSIKNTKVIEHWLDNGEHFHFDYGSKQHIDEYGNQETVYTTCVTEQKGSELERQKHYEYTAYYYVTAFTDALGKRTEYDYNQHHRLKAVSNPDGSQTKYTYHDSQLNSVETLVAINPVTNTKTYRKTDYEYDKQGNLSTVTNALGAKTEFVYNENKQVIQTTDSKGNSSHFEYDDHGNLTKQTLANGSHFLFAYNAMGQRTAQRDCSGNETYYQYDAAGRMLSTIDAKGQQTQLIYDDNSHVNAKPIRIKKADGTTEDFTYDDTGRLISHQDNKKQSTHYEYSIDDLPTTRTDALGQQLSYHYDALRRLSKLINENGEEWTFEYDQADNLVRETRFDGYTSHYKYDDNGQLIEQKDNPDKNKTQQRITYLERDLQGQLLAKHHIDYQNGKRRKHTTLFEYDILGQLIQAKNDDTCTQLEYDDIGQLVTETLYRHHAPEHLSKQRLQHEYDELGNRISTTLPDGKQLKQLYYGSGHLYNQALVDEQGKITEIRHSTTNEYHQEITRQLGNHGQLEMHFDYDVMGRVTGSHMLNNHVANNSLVGGVQDTSSIDNHIIGKSYLYDNIGQLTNISGVSKLSNNQTGALTANNLYQRRHQYEYDELGRLLTHKLSDFANHTGITERFAFDPASNRVPVKAETVVENDNNIVNTTKETIKYTADVEKKTAKWKRTKELTTHDKYIQYYYDSHGRIEFKTQTPIDKNGHPIKQASDSVNSVIGYLETLKLYYSPNNELKQSIKIHQQGFDVFTTTTNYYYDAFGRRVGKRSEVKRQSKLSPKNRVLEQHNAVQYEKTQKQSTFMLWDGNRPVQEYSDSHVFTTVYEQDSFAPVARLAWLQPELLQASNDEVETTANYDGITVFYYHNDHLGTPNELVDDKGNVVWLADYQAWGNTAKVIWTEQKIGNIAVSRNELQPIRFQGQSIDEETGLHYNRFRYYDNDVGMFISRDPIGLMGGDNIFQYAPNPTGWVDPLGLTVESMKDTGQLNGTYENSSINATYIASNLPTIPEDSVLVLVGYGDMLTLGMTEKGRKLLDDNGVTVGLNDINKCSEMYQGGQNTGLVVTSLTGPAARLSYVAQAKNIPNLTKSGQVAHQLRNTYKYNHRKPLNSVFKDKHVSTYDDLIAAGKTDAQIVQSAARANKQWTAGLVSLGPAVGSVRYYNMNHETKYSSQGRIMDGTKPIPVIIDYQCEPNK